MDLIEQAVFTSAETERSAGYQVVATSPGVHEIDARELAVWGPSHDALLDTAPNALSYNFHPLPSGAHCVSRTTPAGWEYSGRGGVRIYTQCLIVPPAVLARFANNPFALLRAALSTGALRLYETVPGQLEPLQLAGRASAVDSTLLARLCVNPGVDWLATLVQAALESITLAIAGGPPAEHVIAGLINCLPPACRTEFSFSTGLRFSSRRPFRVVALSGDAEEQQRVSRLYRLPVLQLSDQPPNEFLPVGSWAHLIHRVLKSGRTSFLGAELSKRRTGFAPEDLPALGLQLLEQLEAKALAEDSAETADTQADLPETESRSEEPMADWPENASDASDMADLPEFPTTHDHSQRAHPAHRRFWKTAGQAPAVGKRPAGPSKSLDLSDHKLLEKLERLDDLVFDAIGGSEAALEELKTAWPQLRSELDAPLLAESREQYLRYALSIWDEYLGAGGVRDPARAVQSLDVLCMLFDEDQ